MLFLTDIDIWLCTCGARLRELEAPCQAHETHDSIARSLLEIPSYRALAPTQAAEAYLRAVAHRIAA